VDITRLTPAEYGAMDWWEYEEILHCQTEFRRASKLYPPGWDARTPERPGETG